MEPLTDEDLRDLEQLAGQATRGPWKFHFVFGGKDSDYHDNTLRGPEGYPVILEMPMKRERELDAWFMAAARSAVPALVAEVRQLRAQVGALERGQDIAQRALDKALVRARELEGLLAIVANLRPEHESSTGGCSRNCAACQVDKVRRGFDELGGTCTRVNEVTHA